MKKLFVVLCIATLSLTLVACGNKEEVKPSTDVNPVQNNTVVNNNEEQETEPVEVPKNEQIGTAGSNIPLKDNQTEAENQVKLAFENWIKEAFGDSVTDARVTVEKIYSAEEEQENEALKDYNLGANEVAFEVKYELKPAEGADVNPLTVANGVYDEESGWVIEKSNLGVLRQSGDEYVLTNVGTGW